MSNQLEKVKELIELRAQARLGGGEKAIEQTYPVLRNYLRQATVQYARGLYICLWRVVFQ